MLKIEHKKLSLEVSIVIINVPCIEKPCRGAVIFTHVFYFRPDHY